MKKFLSRSISTMAALVLAFLGGSYLMAQSTDSAPINDLLYQAQVRAVQAHQDAELINSYARSKDTWHSHAAQINSMKEHINAMGKTMSDMEAARMEGTPWQQEAISDITPLLRSLADHMDAMITHLNNHPNQVHMPAYVDYTKANVDLAARLRSMIEDYVDYAEAKGTVDDLEHKLELQAPATGEQ